MAKYPSVFGPEGTYEYQFQDYLGAEKAYCDSIYNMANYQCRVSWTFEFKTGISEDSEANMKFAINFLVSEHSIYFDSKDDQRTMMTIFPETYNEIKMFIYNKMKSGFVADIDD